MKQRFGTIGLVGICWFVGAVVLLHFVEPGFDPVTDWMSDYATGRSFGWLMNTAFMAAGIGTIAIGLGLRDVLAEGKRVAASWVLMVIAGCSFVVVGMFNGDVTAATELTIPGAIHTLASMVLFVSFLVAAWFLRGVMRRDPALSARALAETVFAILLTVGFVAVFATPEGGPVGITQRLFVGTMMAWLLFLARNIAVMEGSSHMALKDQMTTTV
jgi:hypothetical protein